MENSTTSEVAIPDEFLNPEGDAELQDPDLAGLETNSKTLRNLWAPWLCRKNSGDFISGKFFGSPIGYIPEPAISAYAALEQALRYSGYTPENSWSYKCRKIAGSDNYSLHSYGIAIDLDPKLNPQSSGDPYNGAIKPQHVKAALAIRNSTGASIWSWGGNWDRPDRMHFQLDKGPDHVDVNWSTVPGHNSTNEGINVLTQGSNSDAVKQFQEMIVAWNSNALSTFGPDGDYGSETVVWVRKFQEGLGLTATGSIDGVTAALLTEVTR